MKKIQRFFCYGLLAIGMIFAACGPDARLDLVGNIIGSAPRTDVRFVDSEKYNAEHPFVTIKAPEENYRVYVCTDTHITTDFYNWQNFISAYRADLLCPVALHLGDVVDASNHYPDVVNSFNQIPHNPLKPDTMMLVAGNHDICFSQWDEYLENYKTSVYYFIVETPLGQKDLFIMYDSADGTLGKKQLQWMRNTLEWASKQNFRHIVAGSHTHFFMRDNSQGIATNYSIEETYTLLRLFQSHGIDILFTGHSHSREVTMFDELTCIIVDSMTDEDKKPAYLVATMGEKIDYKFVNLPTKP